MLTVKQSLRSSYPFLLQDVGDFYHGAGTIGVLNKNFQRDFHTVADARMLQHIGINVGGVCDAVRQTQGFAAAQQKPHVMLNAEYKLKPYWDSTLGTTAGNRYVAAAGYNGPVNIAKVNVDGSLSMEALGSASYQGANTYIFAETAGYLFTVYNYLVDPNCQSTSMTTLSYYDKATKLCTLIQPVATHDYQRLIFDGIYGNFAVFLASTLNSTIASYVCGYHIVDLVARTSKYVQFTAPTTGTFYLPNCSISQGVDSADGLSRYFFRPVHGATFSDQLKIDRWKFSKTLAYVDTVTASNRQSCTLVGAPADFVTVMRSTLESNSFLFSYVAHAFKDNGKTYVTVSFVAANPGNNQNVYAPNLGTYVFRLEADETTLTYCSKTMYGYFANVILPTASQKNLIIAQDSNRCTKLQWVGASESYVQSDYVQLPNSISVNETMIAVDSDENVFYTSLDGDARAGYVLQAWNFSQGATVQAKFVGNTNVVWSGTPVDVTVALNAFDAFGARQARTVNLILDGATFKTGGGTAQQFTTDAGQDTLVIISINQSGAISVTPQLV